MNNSLKEKMLVKMLPTEKASNLFIGDLSKKLHYNYSIEKGKSINQHLYIVSEKEIKEGDWYIQFDGGDKNPILRKLLSEEDFERVGGIYKCEERLGYFPYSVNKFGTEHLRDFSKFAKVEATTDRELKLSTSIGNQGTVMFNSLPLISEGFVKKFCELQGNISEVMVEMEAELVYDDAYHINVIQPHIFKPKTDKNNYITITKIKNSYSREEVTNLIIDAVAGSHDYSRENDDIHSMGLIQKHFLNNWIEQNL